MIFVFVKTQKTYHPGISFPCGAGRGGSQQLLNGNRKWGENQTWCKFVGDFEDFPSYQCIVGVGNCNDPWNFQLVSSQVVSNPHVFSPYIVVNYFTNWDDPPRIYWIPPPRMEKTYFGVGDPGPKPSFATIPVTLEGRSKGRKIATSWGVIKSPIIWVFPKIGVPPNHPF